MLMICSWHHPVNDDIMITMRTTLSLDDDLIPQVKTYAVIRDITVGKAVSELCAEVCTHRYGRVS